MPSEWNNTQRKGGQPLQPLDFDHIGPRVGEPFPNVVLPDQHGNPVNLHTARAGRRAMVLFYRSAAW